MNGPLLGDHGDEHAHAAVGVRDRQQQLQRFLRAEGDGARVVVGGGEHPQQDVLGEGAEALRLRA